MIEFKKVKISEVLEKVDVSNVEGNAHEYPSTPDKINDTPLLAAGIYNQGLARYAPKDKCSVILSNVISVSANGANSGAVFYQSEPFSILQDAYVVKIKNHVFDNKEQGLYITGALHKSIYASHSWTNKAIWNRIKEQYITLPFTDNELAWEYMEDQVKALANYLTVTGLDNYELTGEDKEVLAYKPKFKKFKVEEIFSTPGKGNIDLQQKDLNGRGEYFINSGKTNLGIKGKTDKKAKIFPANTITIDFFGNSYYRDFRYKLATHNHVFSFDDKIIKNKEVALYLLGSFQFLQRKFSYSNMMTWDKLKTLNVNLPVVLDTENIDFDYMEKYIKVIQKVTIKDVVKYKDKVIEQSKKVVEDDSNY
ncbi:MULTISPECIES: restriction endonuclease subunit S [unclassified Lactobacillus]|uniref:restriction endonuclease subunit S n=1 Tax=unclassified Lactobacillus TaxID=2620435 RepID=UPI001314C548|nr:MULTISPECIES: restriction endonuclease subunit S [unclassified Lactobacillus]